MSVFDKRIVPRFASISVSSAGANIVVAAQSGKRIRVLHYLIHAQGGANTVKWQSAATDLSGAIDLANDATIETMAKFGVIQTNVGEALSLNLSTATAVTGHIAYILV